MGKSSLFYVRIVLLHTTQQATTMTMSIIIITVRYMQLLLVIAVLVVNKIKTPITIATT